MCRVPFVVGVGVLGIMSRRIKRFYPWVPRQLSRVTTYRLGSRSLSPQLLLWFVRTSREPSIPTYIAAAAALFAMRAIRRAGYRHMLPSAALGRATSYHATTRPMTLSLMRTKTLPIVAETTGPSDFYT